MSDEFQNEKAFSRMMQNSRMLMPSPDFEERTMLRIKQQRLPEKNSLPKYKRLAILFIVLGAGFGFAVTYLLAMTKWTIDGIPSETILMISRVACVLVVLTQLNNILGLLRSTKREHRFTVLD